MKSIIETVDSFINVNYSHINPDEDGVYRPKIKSFYKYLVNELNIPDNHEGVYKLKHLCPYEIFNSMNFFIRNSEKKKNIKKIATLDIYFTVIREYFKFLQKERIVNPEIILEISNWESDIHKRNKLVNDIAVKNGLIKKEEKEPFTPAEVCSLLTKCYDNIKLIDKSKLFNTKKDIGYTQYIASLILILIYETGIKYRVLSSLNVENVNIKEKYIQILNYNIPLSENFIQLLEDYLEFRNSMLSDSKNLFIPSSKSASPLSNEFVVNILRTTLQKFDTTGLAKARIIQLMELGIPSIFIKEWTSFTDVVIEDCKRYITNADNYNYINQQIFNAYTYLNKKGVYLC